MDTAIIIVNWNSWEDTISCIASLLEKRWTNSRIFVVDNGSTDNSILYIENFFKKNNVNYLTINLKEELILAPDVQVYLINGRNNVGYAGGNNWGIKCCLMVYNPKYFWLLNNDTVVDENSLPAMIQEMESDKLYAFVGSVIHYYDNRNIIQCFGGGRIYPLLGKSRLYLKNKNIDETNEADIDKLDYLMGASLLIRSEIIDRVGYMSEEFFMYSEEANWILRSRKNGWKFSVAKGSHIYHKDSASTSGKRHLYHFYRNRSAIIFSKIHFGPFYALITSLNLLIITLIQEIKVPSNVFYGWKGIMEGIRWKPYKS